MTAQRKKRTIRSFQRQVILFVLLTLLVFGAVVYFAFSRTTITITPVLESQAIELELTVAPTADAGSSETGPTLAGTILTTDVETKQTFTDLTESREEPDRAGGTVTIVNHWTKTQPLQAGTRLLSADGVLFRTTERVDVPAGGSVQAHALADEAGKTGEVAPGRFEIVALWPGLKTQIYAESTVAFTGGTKTVSRVTQADLNTARKNTLDAFTSDAKAALEADLTSSSGPTQHIIAILPNIRTENAGAAVGDDVSSFTYTLKGEAVGVALDENAYRAAVASEAAKHLAADHHLERIDEPKTTATVLRVDTEKKIAVLTVSVHAESVVRLASPLFARETIVGLDRQEIQSHFSQFDEIAKVDVHFSPFWVLRAPRLPDHIEIKLNNPVAPSS